MRDYATGLPVVELAPHFAAPPAQYGPIAFWFLNDSVTTELATAQLEEFAAAGFSGVSPCARVGLDPTLGYLTAAWWTLLDHVMGECQRLGLAVILYDEASYPSGSANGAVVAANPDHMARGVVLGDSVTLADGVAADGHLVRYWRPTTGRSLVDHLICAVAGKMDDQDRVIANTVRILPAGEHRLIRIDPAEFPGRWRLLALFDVPSNGKIRGAYAFNDEGSQLAPPAANLLHTESVESFIQLTHDAYAQHLGQWFGNPIVAMFTDEPDIMGRGHLPHAQPWTPALLEDLTQSWQSASTQPTHAAASPTDQVLAMLPSLFVPYDDDAGFAAHFRQTVAERLSRVYYGAQRKWCDDHGIALTGHPSAADGLTPFANFTWTGQDTVWRWVMPGDTSLSGKESANARSAASAARHRGSRTVLNEVFGAYGWRLTIDEMKWLLDWHLVRGTTTFLLHALFLSVRGNRAFESEPDLGLHNAWWPFFPTVLSYLRRASMVAVSLEPVAQVAVLVHDDHCPTDEVAVLYQHQIPFDYVLASDLQAHRDRYRVVAATTRAWDSVAGKEIQQLGLPTINLDDPAADWQAYEPTEFAIPDTVATDSGTTYSGTTDSGTTDSGNRAGLRLARWRDPASEQTWLFLTNEAETQITLELAEPYELWDLWTGERRLLSPQDGDERASWDLPRRSSALLVPVGTSPDRLAAAVRSGSGGSVGSVGGGSIELTAWEARRADGHRWDGPALGDWAQVRELETWAGEVVYTSTLHFDEPPMTPVVLDLGTVGHLARVSINGHLVAECFWPPYEMEVGVKFWRAGANEIEVRVINSSANAYEGVQWPSGLIGPVVVRR